MAFWGWLPFSECCRSRWLSYLASVTKPPSSHIHTHKQTYIHIYIYLYSLSFSLSLSLSSLCLSISLSLSLWGGDDFFQLDDQTVGKKWVPVSWRGDSEFELLWENDFYALFPQSLSLCCSHGGVPSFFLLCLRKGESEPPSPPPSTPFWFFLKIDLVFFLADLVFFFYGFFLTN